MVLVYAEAWRWRTEPRVSEDQRGIKREKSGVGAGFGDGGL